MAAWLPGSDRLNLVLAPAALQVAVSAAWRSAGRMVVDGRGQGHIGDGVLHGRRQVGALCQGYHRMVRLRHVHYLRPGTISLSPAGRTTSAV